MSELLTCKPNNTLQCHSIVSGFTFLLKYDLQKRFLSLVCMITCTVLPFDPILSFNGKSPEKDPTLQQQDIVWDWSLLQVGLEISFAGVPVSVTQSC